MAFISLSLFSIQGKLVVESDSLNAVSWVSSFDTVTWRFQFYFNEVNANIVATSGALAFWVDG